MIFPKEFETYLEISSDYKTNLNAADTETTELLAKFLEKFISILAEVPIESAASKIILLHTHAMVFEGCKLAVCGITLAIFPIFRAALEGAVYSGAIHNKRELESIWINREKDDASRKEARNQLQFNKLLRIIFPDRGNNYSLLISMYDESITFGAHPNPKGILVNSSFDADFSENSALFSLNIISNPNSSNYSAGLIACMDFMLGIFIVILNVFLRNNGALNEEVQVLSDLKNTIEDRLKGSNYAASSN
jgi:hypothetical protein